MLQGILVFAGEIVAVSKVVIGSRQERQHSFSREELANGNQERYCEVGIPGTEMRSSLVKEDDIAIDRLLISKHRVSSFVSVECLIVSVQLLKDIAGVGVDLCRPEFVPVSPKVLLRLASKF